MNKDIRDRIKQLSESVLNDPTTFDSENWTWKIWENVTNLFEANEWECDEVIDNLPVKIQTIFLLEDLKSTINNDGLLSVFYNESLYAIKRLRHAIDLSGVKMAGNLFDKALRLVKSRFTWSNKHINFVDQMDGDVQPYEFFGEKITDRIEEIESQISDILFTDEFEKLLESYIKSP